MLSKLKVYAGPDHPHQAQNPQPKELGNQVKRWVTLRVPVDKSLRYPGGLPARHSPPYMSDALNVNCRSVTNLAGHRPPQNFGRSRSASGRFRQDHDQHRPLEDFFHNDDQHLLDVLSPLVETGKKDQVDVSIRLSGGGVTGAAGACKLGIARALRKHDPETYETLKNAGLLTRDSRMIERKKYGLHKARKATQFSKR